MFILFMVCDVGRCDEEPRTYLIQEYDGSQYIQYNSTTVQNALIGGCLLYTSDAADE